MPFRSLHLRPRTDPSTGWVALVLSAVALWAFSIYLDNPSCSPLASWISPVALICAILFWLYRLLAAPDKWWRPVSILTATLCLLCVRGMVLLPRTSRPSIADRVQCASHLHRIGQALLLYQSDHDGANPPNWATLARYINIPPENWRCPSSTLPAWPKIDPAKSDYIYIGMKLNAFAPPDAMVAYEPLANHGTGMNVLFADGHVEWFSPTTLWHYLNDKTAATQP